MQQLAWKIKQGDERAFQIFFEETHHAMLRYLNKLLHDNRYIDDIIQESYLKVWRHRDQIDPDQPLDNWLFIILRNTALIQLEKQLAEEKRIGKLQWVTAYSLTTDHNEGQVHLQQRDSEKIYTHALLSISPPQRLRYFRLHREQGLSYRQIADMEGVAIKTVEGHITAVLKHLRKVASLNQATIGMILLQVAYCCRFC